MPASARLPVVVAINPSASFGRNSTAGAAVVTAVRRAGHDVVALQEAAYPALEAACRTALDAGARALIVVGGDGMVHLGANLLAGRDIPLGIVAAGSGNDLARGLGLPYRDIPAAVSAVVTALGRPPRAIDAGRLRWTDTAGRERECWFAGALSAGFDARVNERANLMRRPRGPSRYVWAILRELVRLRPLAYVLDVDGVAWRTEGLLAAVANNTSLGGGIRLAPQAILDDGMLDVVVVSRVSRLRFLRLLPLAVRGAHLGLPQVEVRHARRVTISADQPMVAYADGERIAPLPIQIEVASAALQVLVPGD